MGAKVTLTGGATTTYTMSLHPPSGGWSTSPAILTARQPPVVGFLLQCVQGGRAITTEHKDATQSKNKSQITHNCTDAKAGKIPVSHPSWMVGFF